MSIYIHKSELNFLIQNDKFFIHVFLSSAFFFFLNQFVRIVLAKMFDFEK